MDSINVDTYPQIVDIYVHFVDVGSQFFLQHFYNCWCDKLWLVYNKSDVDNGPNTSDVKLIIIYHLNQL